MGNYEKVKAWRKENKEKVAAQARRYRNKHPDKVKKVRDQYRANSRENRLPREAAQKREKRERDPEGEKIRYQRWRDKRNADREHSAGRPKPVTCEICAELHIRIVYDHCHKDGHFRGWICDRCNKVLGLVEDSPELLGLLARYLNNDQTSIASSQITPQQ